MRSAERYPSDTFEHSVHELTEMQRRIVETNMDPLLLPAIIGQKAVQGLRIAPGMELEPRATLAKQCNANYNYLNGCGLGLAQLVGMVDDLRRSCRGRDSAPHEGHLFRSPAPDAPYMDVLTGEPLEGSGFFGVGGSLSRTWLAITDVEAKMLRHGVFDKLDPLASGASCRAEQILEGLREWPAYRSIWQEWAESWSGVPKRIALLPEGDKEVSAGEERMRSEGVARGEASTKLSRNFEELRENFPKSDSWEYRRISDEGVTRLEVNGYQHLPSHMDTALARLEFPEFDRGFMECRIEVLVGDGGDAFKKVAYRWTDYHSVAGTGNMGLLTRIIDENRAEPTSLPELRMVQNLVSDQTGRLRKQWRARGLRMPRLKAPS